MYPPLPKRVQKEGDWCEATQLAAFLTQITPAAESQCEGRPRSLLPPKLRVSRGRFPVPSQAGRPLPTCPGRPQGPGPSGLGGQGTFLPNSLRLQGLGPPTPTPTPAWFQPQATRRKGQAVLTVEATWKGLPSPRWVFKTRAGAAAFSPPPPGRPCPGTPSLTFLSPLDLCTGYSIA